MAKKTDKNKLKEALDKIPEEKQKPKTKKDEVAEAIEILKKKFGFEVEPVKNVKFKIEKIINFINSKYDFRYNVINTDTEYKLKENKIWLYFDDRDYSNVKNDIKKNNVPVGDADLKSLVYSDDISFRYNPFMEYLNGITKCSSEYIYEGADKEKKFKGVKSGRDYIFDFCSQVQLVDEVENRENFINNFRRWFTAMVVGLVTDEPTMYNINQTCLVFVGGQGKYKTTLIKSIVPKNLQLKYYYGSTFQVHNKDHEKFLAYKMLINFDEMAALNRVEIESVKSIISRDQIVVRLPYGKADTHLKRRASFAATQNNKEFLKDDTGSRRWLVFEVDNISIKDDFEIDNMYAQALQHYKDGLQYWFDSNDITKQEEHNKQFQLHTFEYELIQKHYDIPKNEEIRDSQNTLIKYVNSTELAVSLSKDNNINVNNTVIANIGKALAALGFKKVDRRKPGQKDPIRRWAVKEALLENTKPLDNSDESSMSSDII